jgi:hypothetical protein
MRYLTTFCGGQIGKGYEKGITAIEFIGTMKVNKQYIVCMVNYRRELTYIGRGGSLQRPPGATAPPNIYINSILAITLQQIC